MRYDLSFVKNKTKSYTYPLGNAYEKLLQKISSSFRMIGLLIVLITTHLLYYIWSVFSLSLMSYCN